MAIVPASVREWLKSSANFAEAEDATVAAAWGEDATQSEVISPFDVPVDALSAGGAAIAFLKYPLGVETVRVDGDQHHLVGTAIRLQADGSGYPGAGNAAAAEVFVIGAAEEGGATLLNVLRRLDQEYS